MGAFAEYQPLYADHHVITFPVDDATKKPSVARPQRVGPGGSRQLVLRFPANDALGFWAGPRNGVTVLDVDVPDERVLADRLSRHGETPLIVRSPSGKFHAYYRHNGERRVIRDGGAPVDILGAGLVIAPPSNMERGRYQIIRGNLDDLDRLPTMRGLGAEHYDQPAAPLPPRANKVGEGNRNEAVWRQCMKVARYEDTFDELLDYARTFNEDAVFPPLPDAEVVRAARSAWDYQEKGRNRFGRGQAVMVEFTDVDGLLMQDPDAFMLLVMLRRQHWGRDFVIANAMAEIMPGGGWTRKRLAAARAALEASGRIELTKAATRHEPARYRWPAV